MQRIQRARGLPDKAIAEVLKLLPRATYHHQNGAGTRASWGRAAVEFPELSAGRRMVEVLLACKSSISNVGHRFNVFMEQKSVGALPDAG